jgi:hypothetical protein
MQASRLECCPRGARAMPLLSDGPGGLPSPAHHPGARMMSGGATPLPVVAAKRTEISEVELPSLAAWGL